MLRADFKNQVSKLFGPEMGKNDRFGSIEIFSKNCSPSFLSKQNYKLLSKNLQKNP